MAQPAQMERLNHSKIGSRLNWLNSSFLKHLANYYLESDWPDYTWIKSEWLNDHSKWIYQTKYLNQIYNQFKVSKSTNYILKRKERWLVAQRQRNQRWKLSTKYFPLSIIYLWMEYKAWECCGDVPAQTHEN